MPNAFERLGRQQLAQADRHVALGLKRIARQREIIAELDRDGHVEAAEQARALLNTLLETQSLHEIDRDRIRAKYGLPPQSN